MCTVLRLNFSGSFVFDAFPMHFHAIPFFFILTVDYWNLTNEVRENSVTIFAFGAIFEAFRVCSFETKMDGCFEFNVSHEQTLSGCDIRPDGSISVGCGEESFQILQFECWTGLVFARPIEDVGRKTEKMCVCVCVQLLLLSTVTLLSD